MAARETEIETMDSASHQETFAGLRGRQSVRATFKLTSVCIEAISIVAGQLGIKQKSLFDHLFQDADTLKVLAAKLNHDMLQHRNRVQKTYVLSRSALIRLEEVAKRFNASRDALIEHSVQRLMPIIAAERKRYAKRKDVFRQVRQHLEGGRQLLQKAFSELGEEDPLTERLAAVMAGYDSAYKQMAGLISKTRGIEDFEPETLKHVQTDESSLP